MKQEQDCNFIKENVWKIRAIRKSKKILKVFIHHSNQNEYVYVYIIHNDDNNYIYCAKQNIQLGTNVACIYGYIFAFHCITHKITVC